MADCSVETRQEAGASSRARPFPGGTSPRARRGSVTANRPSSTGGWSPCRNLPDADLPRRYSAAVMTLGDDASYDVRVWALSVYKGSRGTSYTVTWLVAGFRHRQTFATRKLAESFRAGIVTAARGGGQFFASDGLPASMRTSQMGRSWYAHACAFMDMKWAHALQVTAGVWPKPSSG